MTETSSKSRQTADLAFGKVQSQFVARKRVFDELDLIVVARDEKTLRLREARLAKEAQDQLSLLAKKPSRLASKA
ncbi:hypothetical protein OSH10_04735 [Kaistia defluvii]|uniref:hypothetical protein n=1 Tax=Kaistia defluvii TaxID=410841 RepID=UPI002255B8C3|nr:hypothetical protein [Kaistia defluvii]MCX5517733.1 hypothetical protein [Kaistia defluvii]